MPVRFLCLHGWGTNIQILQSQLGPLMRELQKDNSAEFHFIQGDVEADPGPGIEGFYEGPYYSFYQFPRTFPDSDDEEDDGGDASMFEAYEMIYDIIAEEGPFDGILGFSHGGTLASGFLIHHSKTSPYTPPPFRCAVFFNSLPPFRMDPGEELVVDDDLARHLTIPTLSIAGTRDFVYKQSLMLHQLCDEKSSQLILHGKGHEIPGDAATVARMAKAFRALCLRAMYL
uniref:Hydrolase 341 n=1 Tax=Paecilomyces divaricatus TaxID=644132 RepID=A0A3G1IHJ7_PAEDI|nr:hydrolase 341 [Paecilomyces divaricatus]